MSLDQLFYPRRVAVVGSMSPGKLGYELVRQVLLGGYREMIAVNPKAQGVGDVPGFTSIAAAGVPVDLAVIASPAAGVPGVLEDCGRAGVAAAVIISAGFAEAGNAAGEAEIRNLARQNGIRVVGPNCAGMLCAGSRLYATLESRPPAGAAALISQSGALAGAVLSWAEEQGLGFSKFVSYGNRADLDEVDLLPYFAQDPETRVIALYIESVANGRAFMSALEACARQKPVVVIKAGRTGSGRRAALSHTGSLAGTDAVYDAALRQCGAIRVKTVEEMFDVCKGFVHLPRLRGRRVVIVTNSGGPGVMAADVAEESGLQVAEPSPALRQRLAGFLPAHCALRNPIDLTVEGTENGYREALVVALDEYDAALALNVATPYLDSLALARGVCEAAARTGKPVVANFMAGPVVVEGLAYLQSHAIPNFAIGERAVNVLGKLAGYYEQAGSGAYPGVSTLPPVTSGVSPSYLGLQPSLLEPDAMAWLRSAGLCVPDYRSGADESSALAACAELGYPVVMKVVSPDISHKSESGGVVVDIRDEAAARAAFRRIQAATVVRGAGFCGVVIYRMVRDAQEVLVGLSRDPQFGPVVACGLGGIYTEILHDVVLRVAPVDRSGAMAMLREMKAIGLLAGARNRPVCDLGALAGLVERVSQLSFCYPALSELDLNPVFALPDGAVIGDVRVVFSAGERSM
jgi:acetate---CoA ligase (ADP-forming)